ncbi:MAG: hypothetical protein HOL07_13640 [Rhodospirillaceae bacterium]|jgi:hypothetical protein|nr:hypothetical protein [Rhodospirillaceae bacterium]MBT4772091.1 hypothetical protein [Rhodospirillaceae bacterium]MBT5359378.1 hypothetical protein [Rhodospirillaceae bacterium]MBT5768429.1 hypothetical protein [Rhodospirillaceae bacterium]MBT6309540.1 hypothetical protein [Rhodospirillaceae bacterium]
MAPGKKKTPAIEKKPAKQSGSAYMFVVLGMILLGLMIFAAPALLLFAVGCIPAMVAYIIDREPGRNATLTVGAANVAGVAPFIFELLLSGPTMDRALAMLSDVFVVVVMFGTAGVGWLLVLGMPKIAAVYIDVTNEAKIKQMRREQKRLIEEWGDEVMAPAGA